MSLNFVSAAKRVRNARLKFIIFSNKLIILSFKFVKCYMGLYIWETILSETLTKMNANRRNWFCCLVLSYCDRRIWIAIDENGWQSTKLNDNVSKVIDQRRNWNEYSYIPEFLGRNWKHIFKTWMKSWRKWAGKPIFKSVLTFKTKHHISSKFLKQ